MSFEDYGFDLLLRPYLSKIQTIGNLNAFLEIVLYDIRTQPLYVIMDSKMNLIIDHFGSVRDPEILESKLSEALQKLN